MLRFWQAAVSQDLHCCAAEAYLSGLPRWRPCPQITAYPLACNGRQAMGYGIRSGKLEPSTHEKALLQTRRSDPRPEAPVHDLCVQAAHTRRNRGDDPGISRNQVRTAPGREHRDCFNDRLHQSRIEAITSNSGASGYLRSTATTRARCCGDFHADRYSRQDRLRIRCKHMNYLNKASRAAQDLKPTGN